MESMIYQLLKDRKTTELIAEIEREPEMLDFVDSRGATLLMLSYYFRNEELSNYVRSRKKPRSIYEAVITGDLAMTEGFLASEPSLLNRHSPDGFTPLGFAAYFGREEVARLLVARGADVNLASSNGFNVAPLHSAVAAGNVAITELLLQGGAHVDARQQQDVTPLHSAAHNKNLVLVSMLLAAGADKNLVSQDGKSAWHYAQEAGSREVMDLLA